MADTIFEPTQRKMSIEKQLDGIANANEQQQRNT